jgi:hypothetical protein
LGYTDIETVKLDLDKIPFKQAKYWATRICSWFKLGGFAILKSSVNCYHVVFDRKVTWNVNVKIMAWACLVSKHRGLTGWFILQCIKKGSTLRVSPKKDKPAPRIVYRQGRQDGQIRDFRNYRRLLASIQSRIYNRSGSGTDHFH